MTGAINDKKALYSEYAAAKIFALTSDFEGGTPNVYAEALFHGCAFITSDIDACDDITNNRRLGVTYELDDVADLAESLVSMCRKTENETFIKRHIPEALAYAEKYYDWNKIARKLALALYL